MKPGSAQTTLTNWGSAVLFHNFMKAIFTFLLTLAVLYGSAQTKVSNPGGTQVDSLISVAQKLQKEGDWKQALLNTEEAIALIRSNPDLEPGQYPQCYYLAGMSNYYLGEYGLAEQYFQKHKDVIVNSHPDFPRTLNMLGLIYKQLRRFDESETQYMECKAIREAEGINANYCGVVVNLASLYHTAGRLKEAEAHYLEARHIFEETLNNREHRFYLNCLNNIAALYGQLGRFEAAEKLHFEVSAMLLNANKENTVEYANNTTNLANLYIDVGRYPEAEELLLRAKDIQEKVSGKQSERYGLVLNNLAVLYQKQKRFWDAEQIYLESAGIYEGLSETSNPIYALALSNLGTVYTKMKRFQEAEKLHLAAHDIMDPTLGKEHSYHLSNLNNFAVMYGEMEDYARALPLFSEASAGLHQLLSKSVFYLSERELADYSEKYVDAVHTYLSYSMKSGSNNQMAALCYDNMLFYKGFLLSAHAKLKNMATADASASALFAQLQLCHLQLAQQYSLPIAARQNLEPLENKANTLEKNLAQTLAPFGDAIRQVTWQEVQRQLKPGEAAIEFVHFRHHNPDPTDSVFYSALVLRHGDAPPQLIPLFEERELRNLLQGTTSNTQRKISQLYAAGPNGKGHALYQLIWKPLEEALQGAGTVYCSLSGELHRLNLGAVPLPAGQVFSEKHNYIVLGSTRHLVLPQPVAQPPQQSAYVVGGVRYEAKADNPPDAGIVVSARTTILPDMLSFTADTTTWGGKLQYLTHSLSEAYNVKKALEASQFVVRLNTGHYATETTFKSLGTDGPSPRVIHLATHGYFFPDPKEAPDTDTRAVSSYQQSTHPLIRSGLLMAHSQTAWQGREYSTEPEDGVLTAYEISRMNLGDTELVVLSACETGLGDIKGNEGVYGLQRAFKIAGVRNLIMSLWNLNDKTSRLFMEEFYKNWLTESRSIREAFRATQLEMKKRYPEDAFHWAGFVLVE
mgnify:CR=1 FL=1